MIIKACTHQKFFYVYFYFLFLSVWKYAAPPFQAPRAPLGIAPHSLRTTALGHYFKILFVFVSVCI
jgi:hypothetical protein